MSQACRLRARMTSMVSEPLRLIGGLSDKDDPRGVLVADSEPGLGPAAAISDACSAPTQVGERKVWGSACLKPAASPGSSFPLAFLLPPSPSSKSVRDPDPGHVRTPTSNLAKWAAASAGSVLGCAAAKTATKAR